MIKELYERLERVRDLAKNFASQHNHRTTFCKDVRVDWDVAGLNSGWGRVALVANSEIKLHSSNYGKQAAETLSVILDTDSAKGRYREVISSALYQATVEFIAEEESRLRVKIKNHQRDIFTPTVFNEAKH